MTDLTKAAQAALENLEAVLCDPEGRAGIHGSDGDLKIIDEALDGLRAALAAQPVAQEPRVCWLVEEFSDSGNSTGRYMQDQNDLTITTDAQKARQFLRSRTATFRATDMREKWGTAWRPVSHVFRARSHSRQPPSPKCK